MRPIAALVAAVVLGSTALLIAQSRMFPGPPTDTNPRANTPNDPDFDRAEPDDEDGDYVSGTSVFAESNRLFGFAPSSTSLTARYLDPGNPHFLQPQVSGVSTDLAWKLSIGDPSVGITICDTGIRWERESLRRRIRLNLGEVPVPCGPLAGMKGQPLAAYDCDGDGQPTAEDFAGLVGPAEGPHGDPTKLDAEDIIVHYSDGVDDDGNGFVDDIAGWDFFDDDNDPFDASSYSSADNHGSGRAEDAAAEGNDDQGSLGHCPRCRITPIRIWDTFVANPNNFALCMLYAADNGIPVIEAAIGALTTTEFAQAATQYAYEHGVALMEVSSDLDTADHNTPTNFNNTIYVKGVVADAEGLSAGGNEIFPAPVPLATQVPVGTWLRDSNLTQYGGHAHIAMKGVTGSECTGQASGAAGLLISYGRQRGTPLTPNEVKQILTLTADDVLPDDVLGLGVPDPAQTGWDQHYGYGRVNLRAALQRVGVPALGIAAKIPPEATLERPNWFDVLDFDRDNDGVNESLLVPIRGTASAERGASTALSWTLEFGIGIEPTTFTAFASGSSGTRVGFDGSTTPPRRPGAPLGTLNLATVMAAFPPGTNFSAPPSGVVTQGAANVPSNQFAFTVRLRVVDGDDPTNVGEDRKVFFVHHDPTKHLGWPIAIDANADGLTDGGGESPPQMADLDGDDRMELVQATAAGRLYAFRENGSLLPGFPIDTATARNVTPHLAAHVFASGAIDPPAPTTSSRPAIADLDGDGYPEIVYANLEGDVYAFTHDGALVPGFPVRVDPALSAPALRSKTNHVKTGIFGSPVLADVDGDGSLDIVVAALDQHLYVWNRLGALLSGFPVLLQDPNPGAGQSPAGAESINTPVVADLDGDGHPEIVVETNEVYAASGNSSQFFPSNQGLPTSIPGLTTGTVLSAVFANAGGSGRVYAVHADGSFVAGWPIAIDGLAIDVLPLIGPGHNVAVGDLDPSPGLEVAASLTTGTLAIFRPNGTRIRDMDPSAHGPLSDATQDPSGVLNLFEYPTIGDVDRDGQLDLMKTGVTLQGLVNLVLAGQNQPFHHVLQAWTAGTGAPLPGYPKVIDDFGLTTVPLVANVGATTDVGDTLNLPEIVSGNGLYLVHATDAAGREATGWPKLTGGWHTGQPAAGDLDDDGLMEIAWSTREGNYFVWDTPAPICNTAVTPNLDGRDGAYNPVVNTRNNGRYGEDTVPPARLRAGDVSGTSVDVPGNGLTFTVTRIPGDDMYCGTATALDFRFSTSGAITTQAAFDAATPVASVPTPPAGNHNAGGSLAVHDAAFAGQLVYLAVQVVDDAGNRSPLTALGSFDFRGPTTTSTSSTSTSTTSTTTTTTTTTIPGPTTTSTSTIITTSSSSSTTTTTAPGTMTWTLQRATLTFGRAQGGGDDRISLRGILPVPLSWFDPATEGFHLGLSDADGPILSADVAAGLFVAGGHGTRVRYRNKNGGLTNVTLKANRDGTTRLQVKGRLLSMTGVDRPEITTTVGLGADTFQSTNTFRPSGARFRFP